MQQILKHRNLLSYLYLIRREWKLSICVAFSEQTSKRETGMSRGIVLCSPLHIHVVLTWTLTLQKVMNLLKSVFHHLWKALCQQLALTPVIYRIFFDCYFWIRILSDSNAPTAQAKSTTLLHKVSVSRFVNHSFPLLVLVDLSFSDPVDSCRCFHLLCWLLVRRNVLYPLDMWLR